MKAVTKLRRGKAGHQVQDLGGCKIEKLHKGFKKFEIVHVNI